MCPFREWGCRASCPARPPSAMRSSAGSCSRPSTRSNARSSWPGSKSPSPSPSAVDKLAAGVGNPETLPDEHGGPSRRACPDPRGAMERCAARLGFLEAIPPMTVADVCSVCVSQPGIPGRRGQRRGMHGRHVPVWPPEPGPTAFIAAGLPIEEPWPNSRRCKPVIPALRSARETKPLGNLAAGPHAG